MRHFSQGTASAAALLQLLQERRYSSKQVVLYRKTLRRYGVRLALADLLRAHHTSSYNRSHVVCSI
jgi:ribosomal protein L32